MYPNMLCVCLASAAVLLAPAVALAKTPERIQRGQLITEGVPEIPFDRLARIRQYNEMRPSIFQGFDEKGGIVVLKKSGETEQLNIVSAPRAKPVRITSDSEPVSNSGGGVRPDGSNTSYFLRDRGGDEFYQGFLLNHTTGSVAAFTEAGARVDNIIFDKDGKKAAWSVARSGEAKREIVVGDPSIASDRKVVIAGPPGIQPYGFSPDGSKLLYGHYISSTEAKRFLLDIKTGQSTPLNPSKETISYGFSNGGKFSADGKSVFLLSDQDSNFIRLIRIDLESGRKTVLTRRTAWDIETFELSSDGRQIAYIVNEDGTSRLYIADAATGRALPTPKVPAGSISRLRFDRKGERLGFSLSTPTTPGDAWVWDLRTGSLTQWTESERGGIPETAFAVPTLIKTASFDKLKIPAFLYKPKTPGPHPVIIQIHGGPEAQALNEFVDPRVQYWVNEMGVAVMVPNIRGSVGYGKAYLASDNGFKREDALKDIGALIDWIGTQPDLDKNRIAVHGGSYGGYSTLAALARYSERLAGGISIVGSSNLVSFLENTQAYRRDSRRAEYGDERDPAMRAFQTRIAPLTNAHRITKPLFVVQGANDPRVPQSESEQIVAAVRKNGGDAWYMLALDEGHGFAKQTNVQSWIGAEILFFERIFGLKQ
jgi:dipeptidyl aminopeptidase/acylaminoacyl peptidase